MKPIAITEYSQLLKLYCVDLLTNPIILTIFNYNRYIQTKFQFFIMTTCYPDTMTVKRDLQRRIEDYVVTYCKTLEENFKQGQLRSYKRNIQENRFPENSKYYQERIEEINNGTANLYKFDYTVGKKFIKVFNLQYQESNEYLGTKSGYRSGSVHCFVDKNTGQVYKPASWKAPAKIVRFDLRLITDREFLFNPNNIDWAGGHLYLR